MNYGYDIRELPVGMDFCRARVEKFLERNGLRLEPVDSYVGIFDADDNMVGGGGLSGDVIKCVAVNESERGTGLLAALVTRLQTMASRSGHAETMVYTKPENERLFRDLGYVLLGRAPQAVLMESSEIRLRRYKEEWRKGMEAAVAALPQPARDATGQWGVCIINANPFTRGHQYLIETAARRSGRLVVMVVSEDVSAFTFEERIEMVRRGTSHIPGVAVVPSGPYAVSAATFPTYFLKNASAASETQMLLDADVFCRHIATALGAATRFVGSEPYDALTGAYNDTLREELRRSGLDVVEIARKDGISASQVRRGAWRDVPTTSLPFVLSYYAHEALRAELDLTPKPGLVDREDRGAHYDMDYRLMRESISALRPHFRIVSETALKHSDLSDGELLALIVREGQRAHQEMLRRTGGVNTHGGALFSFGLVVCAFSRLVATDALEGLSEFQDILGAVRNMVSRLATLYGTPTDTHGGEVRRRYPGTGGAVECAVAGFPAAAAVARPSRGIPSYAAAGETLWHEGMSDLLSIMSQLDDTNILYRADKEVLSEVRHTAERLLRSGFSEEDIRQLNSRFVALGISPGGSADMFALSMLLSLICTPSSPR